MHLIRLNPCLKLRACVLHPALPCPALPCPALPLPCLPAPQCWEDVEDVRREVEVLETVKSHPYIVSIIDTMEDEKVRRGGEAGWAEERGRGLGGQGVRGWGN